MIRLVSAALLCAVSLFAAQSAWDFLDHSTVIFVLLALLLVCSAFFSASEIALVSISNARVAAMIDKKLSGSRAISNLKSNSNRLLITILIGNNLVNIGASVLATAWATQLFGSVALGWITGILTVIILICGEIFPKVFAQKHNELFSRFCAPILLGLRTILLPLVLLLEWLLDTLMARVGEISSSQISTLAELKALIGIVGEKHEIDPNLQDILESTFKFDNTKTKEIMTPKERVISVQISDTIDHLRDTFVQKGRSRIVVFDGARAVGLINMHMLLEAQTKSVQTVGDIELLEPIRVDAAAFIDDLLARFQAVNQQLALVYEAGEFAGVVSVENILEEIVGEMHDEKEPTLRHAFFGAKKRALIKLP